jgi:hypothetical protein
MDESDMEKKNGWLALVSYAEYPALLEAAKAMLGM